jgi:hypothetical protein
LKKNDMKKYQQNLHFCAASMAALLFALPSAAKAEADIQATSGSGPNGFSSTEVRGNADLFDSSLSVNVLGFKSDSSTADTISQSAFGLEWKTSKLATLGVTRNKQDNGLINISGNTLSLALALQTLWDSKLQTRLDLKRAASEYRFNNLPAPYDTSKQTANTFGLSQDIAEPVTLYVTLDRYSYDSDPKQSAIRMIKIAPRRFFSTASTLLSFPDSTNTYGITWRMTEAFTVDVSSSKTSTQLDQELKTRRLGLDYQATDHLNFTVAVSRVSATAVVTKRTIFPGIPALTIPAGTTVMPATDDTYREIGLGWTF